MGFDAKPSLVASDGETDIGNIGSALSIALHAIDPLAPTIPVTLTRTTAGSKQALDVNLVNALSVGVADKTSFIYGTTTFLSVGGVYQDTSPTLTSGESGALRLTANRGVHVNLRDSAGTEIDSTDGALNTSVTNDGLKDGGVYGAITLTTGGTAYEAKVGFSALSGRKSLVITALDAMYWGYDSSVTVATGIPLKADQQIIFSIIPGSTFKVWLVASGNNKKARIAESP